MRFVRLFLTVLFLLLPAALWAQALTGTKTVGGTSPDYATIIDAANAVNANGVGAGGVTFLIRSGTYDGQVTLTAVGTAANPIIFQPDGAASVTVTSSASGNVFYLNGAQYVTIEGLTLNAVNQHGVFMSTTAPNNVVRGNTINLSVDSDALLCGVRAEDGGTIEGNTITLTSLSGTASSCLGVWHPWNGTSVIRGNDITVLATAGGGHSGIIASATSVIERNIIRGSGPACLFGIDVGNTLATPIEIRNNIVYGFQLGQINLSNANPNVSNNTFVTTSSNVVVMFFDQLGGDWKNNIFCHMGASGAIWSKTGSSTFMSSDYNLYHAPNGVSFTLALWRGMTGLDANSIEADPQFLDLTPGSENLHIAGSSPCIDRGTTVAGVTQDFDGDARPIGPAPDIGADETSANALTGTKTVGGALPDYLTIVDAATALNTYGVGSGGVTFLIRDGTYNGEVALTTGGTAANPVVFQPDGAAAVTVDGGSSGPAFRFVSAGYVTIQDLTLRAFDRDVVSIGGADNISLLSNAITLNVFSGSGLGAIDIGSSTGSVIEGNTITLAASSGSPGDCSAIRDDGGDALIRRNSIVVNTTAGGLHEGMTSINATSTIDGNIIRGSGNCAYIGISLADALPMTLREIRNNVVWGFYGTQVRVWNSEGNFSHNSLYATRADANLVLIDTTSFATTWKNNIFYHAGTGSSTSAGGTVFQTVMYYPKESDYNLFYIPNGSTIGRLSATLADWQSATLLDANSIASDPQFLDVIPGNEDFHIAGTSPCIDMATPIAGITEDFEGDARPMDSGPDIGADETLAGSSSTSSTSSTSTSSTSTSSSGAAPPPASSGSDSPCSSAAGETEGAPAGLLALALALFAALMRRVVRRYEAERR